MKFPKLILFLVVVCIFGFSAKVKAASFFTETNPAQQGEIDVFLNTEGTAINALDLTLGFNPADFQINYINDGNSAISLWVEPVSFSNQTGTIHFAGTIPGGLLGIRVPLLQLFVNPEKSGQTDFSVQQSQILLNDGLGTPTNVSQNSFSATLPAASNQNAVADNVPPEDFTPTLTNNPAVFDGKWFIIWNTTDKGSGIDHYEVVEVQRGNKIPSTGWTTATSPYLLSDQSLKSDIYVKAVDHAGNSRISKVPPQYPSPLAYIILVGTLLLLGISVWFFRSKKIWKF